MTTTRRILTAVSKYELVVDEDDGATGFFGFTIVRFVRSSSSQVALQKIKNSILIRLARDLNPLLDYE